MTQAERPDQIATILKTVVADYPADMVANLDAYLVDLEARQSEQLKPITAILNTIVAELPLAEGASLTAYITWLETHQQAALAKTSVEPESLYWRLERRAAQRRERALRKLEYAQ